jgi:hypothetical protein
VERPAGGAKLPAPIFWPPWADAAVWGIGLAQPRDLQTRPGAPDAIAAAPGAVDLAKNIATTQQQEIDVMTDLLTRI